ncbi:MAG: diguanylate cyclase [Zavarzinia sp.]|nr:diguanylate cyclase [Zavarzinia sp.]
MRVASSIVAFLLRLTVVLAVLFAPAGVPRAETTGLTPYERAHVEHLGSIRFCADPDWMPFEWVDGAGRHRGIGADILALVAQRVGLTLELRQTADWGESLAAARSGQCGLLSFLNRTPEREQWLRFTEPVFDDPNVIVTREEHALVSDPHDLAGETMVLPEGTSIEERIRRDYPEIRIVLTASEQEAMRMVSDRRADMTLRSLIVAAYTIRNEGLFNLKIAGRMPEYTNRLRIAVTNGDTILRDILDKGVATLTDEDRERIVNAYVSIRIEQPVDYDLLARVVGGVIAALMIAAAIIWYMTRLNRELRRQSRTDALTGLANRKVVEMRLGAEIARARRRSLPLSVIMVDVDHFKSVNDHFGHAVGDRVLTGIARHIETGIRRQDLAGRFGGEEFVVICPESGVEGAVGVAERIRLATAAADFGLGHPLTISAGVAALRPEDTMENLLTRCDGALYAAKHAGRNRTVA